MLQQIIWASLSEPHLDKIARVFVIGGSSSLILCHDKYGSLILPAVFIVSRSQTPPLFDIWTAGRESGALTLKLLFKVLPMTSLVIMNQ